MKHLDWRDVRCDAGVHDSRGTKSAGDALPANQTVDMSACWEPHEEIFSSPHSTCRIPWLKA